MLGLAVALGACKGDVAGPEVPQLTVSGTLDGPGVASLPEGARVVVWGVTSTSPDYSYVYGGGTIDRATGWFTVTLPSAPPAEALNQVDGYALGVGTLLVVRPDFAVATGVIDEDELPMSAVLGAAGQRDTATAHASRGMWRRRPNAPRRVRGCAPSQAGTG